MHCTIVFGKLQQVVHVTQQSLDSQHNLPWLQLNLTSHIINLVINYSLAVTRSRTG